MKRIYLCTCLFMLFVLQEADAQKTRTYRKKTIRKTAVTKTKPPQSVNQSMLLCHTMYNMPSWYMVVNNNFRFPVDMQPPAQYRLATTNDTLLTKYLKTVPYDIYNRKIMLPLFRNNNFVCKEFSVQRVVTMDSSLQAKFPGLMSFKAVDDENPLYTARIDCDGLSTRIMISLDGEVYYATPFIYNRKTYYACYSQNDPNFIKKNFE